MNRLPVPALPPALRKPPARKPAAIKPKASTVARGIGLSFPHRAAFDHWVAAGLALAAHYGELTSALVRLNEDAPSREAVRAAEDLLFRYSADELAEATAKFMHGLSIYERAELYEADGSVRVEFVAAAVALMMMANPRGSLSITDDLAGLLVDELLASGATASRVEYVTRKLSREHNYVPGLSLILKTLAEAQTPEHDDAFERDFDGDLAILWARRDLANAVAEAKAAPPRLPPPGPSGRVIPLRPRPTR